MILLCHDGSADARAAIDRAAHTMPGAAATVLTIWEPFLDTMSRTGSLGRGLASAAMYDGDGEIDCSSRAVPGTGLGLPLARTIVARHGGEAQIAAAWNRAPWSAPGARGVAGSPRAVIRWVRDHDGAATTRT